MGDPIANKSVAKMVKHFSEILAYADGAGSINMYMAAGGTNFGFTAGALKVVSKRRTALTCRLSMTTCKAVKQYTDGEPSRHITID